MKKIVRPPFLFSAFKDLNPLRGADLEALPKLIAKHRATDEQGRYLPWNELRHRISKEEKAELVWFCVKLARRSLLKKLPLNAESEDPFLFCVTDTMQRRLHEIDRTCGPRIDPTDLGVTSHHKEAFLVESLMMEEAITSAQLEGASTTRKVAKQMLEAQREPRTPHERMVFNNYLLMKTAKNSKDQELTLELIREFHRVATEQTDNPDVIPGQFRMGDDVVVEGRERDIVHQPPPAAQIVSRLQALCDFANSISDGKNGGIFIHPCVKAAMLHFMIGYEHPFADGNGRTARALFYWFMLKQGYWPFEYVSISSLLHRAPVKYGESYIHTETDDFDLTYFIDYQLEIIERAVKAFLDHVQAKQKAYYDTVRLLEKNKHKLKLNTRQTILLEKAIRSPGRVFFVKAISEEFGITENTARKDLQKLSGLKLLAEGQDGKTVLYVARGDIVSMLK